MKKTYHICLSAGNEVMFRDEKDYIRGFNSFALALYKTQSTGLVESFMSNHCHMVVQTSEPKDFMRSMRMSYSKYFNIRYDRSGSVGEKQWFVMEVSGLYHHIAAMSYVLRNPLHHGVSPTSYGYPHSSVNVIFKKEMGKFHSDKTIHPRFIARHIGKRAEYPSHYKMNEAGLFLRETVLDIPQVEHFYVTPRTFDYYMNRKSSEEWIKKQQKDDNGDISICLDNIETGTCLQATDKMLVLENGRADYRRISDIDLCKEIDLVHLPVLGVSSIYQLGIEAKKYLAEKLYRKYRVPEDQIKRCLAM